MWSPGRCVLLRYISIIEGHWVPQERGVPDSALSIEVLGFMARVLGFPKPSVSHSSRQKKMPRRCVAPSAHCDSPALFDGTPVAVCWVVQLMSGDLSDGAELTTLQGAPLIVNIADDGTVSVGGAAVVSRDHEAGNGVVHVIDSVLMPPVTLPEPEEPPVTLPAAEEEQQQQQQEEEVVKVEEQADRGLVLGPVVEPEGQSEPLPETVAILIRSKFSLVTLSRAIKVAGLVDELSAQGPLTVFAPNNRAFLGAVTTLGTNPKDLLGNVAELQSLLPNHVVSGKVRCCTIIRV